MDSSKVLAQFQNIEGILGALTVLNLVGYQWPRQAKITDGAEFDFVIVGAGTAGCVVANRLVELGNFSVLLVEAGDNPFESEMPGLFPYLKGTSVDWNFTTIPDNVFMRRTHKNNAIEMIQGKMIGGTGSLNYMGYERGNQYDYDRWAKITNDSIWSWESVLPTFLKYEKLTDRKILSAPHFYGTDGKIKIAKQYFRKNDEYFAAFKELGWDSSLDINPDNPLGFTNIMFSIGDGVRQSSARKFLSLIKDDPNLHMMKNTLATKIIFDQNNKAVGVELLTKNNEMLTVKAKKEVIVSAGAIKSPQLLMLSGIGPKSHLESLGIKVIADLPVGKNFQDHVNMHLIYEMKKAKKEEIYDINPHKYPFSIFEGFLALNRSQKHPDYQIIGVTIEDKALLFGLCIFYFNFNDVYCKKLAENIEDCELLLAYLTYLYPKSRGEILLGSADPHEHPIIKPGYYSNREDMDDHVTYLQDFNRILETSYFKKVDTKLVLPELEHCKGLEEGSEEYWRCYAVGMSDTAYYYVGTCGMGSVLDSRLRVLGVKNLRVIDASSFPDTVGAFTQATVLMVAQKGAEFIIEER